MPAPLTKKLRIKEGSQLYALHAPTGFKKVLGDLPAGAGFTGQPKNAHQIHWFVRDRQQLESELHQVLSLVKEQIICWVYYPKGSSGIQTDLTRDKGWDALRSRETDYTWISLISVDDTWSAFGFRLSSDADKAKSTKPAIRPVMDYIDPVAKTVRLPEELTAAFKKNKQEEKFFQALAYSHRKEYVEWIVSAKQEETRKKRVESMMERLARQWKNPQNR